MAKNCAGTNNAQAKSRQMIIGRDAGMNEAAMMTLNLEIRRCIWCLSVLPLGGPLTVTARATENLPRIPFAESARLPEPDQLVVTPWYSYSMFRKLWIGEKKTSIEMQPEKDFEVNDGLVRLDYGLNRQFALDTTFGWTSAATESWNPRGKVQATRGLIDTQIGVRYRVLDENR